MKFVNLVGKQLQNLEQLLGLISANAAGLENVSAPARLDVAEESAYPDAASFDYIFNANMAHISEWRCTEGLFKLAGKVLRRGHGTGLLFLYGPFAVDGVLEPESNVRFDSMLRNGIQQASLSPSVFERRLKSTLRYFSWKSGHQKSRTFGRRRISGLMPNSEPDAESFGEITHYLVKLPVKSYTVWQTPFLKNCS